MRKNYNTKTAKFNIVQYTPTLVYLQISWKIYHLFLFRGPLKIWAHLRLGYTFIGSCNFLHFKSKNATIHRRRKQIESEGGLALSKILTRQKSKKRTKTKNSVSSYPHDSNSGVRFKWSMYSFCLIMSTTSIPPSGN